MKDKLVEMRIVCIGRRGLGGKGECDVRERREGRERERQVKERRVEG